MIRDVTVYWAMFLRQHFAHCDGHQDSGHAHLLHFPIDYNCALVVAQYDTLLSQPSDHKLPRVVVVMYDKTSNSSLVTKFRPCLFGIISCEI
jgi:hypothetical protein